MPFSFVARNFSRILGVKILKAKSAKNYRFGRNVLLAALLVFGNGASWAQAPGVTISSAEPAIPQVSAPTNADPDTIARWEGSPVRTITFDGISASRLAPLPDHLAQGSGVPLQMENVKRSLRQLFATGLYETIQAEASPDRDGVALLFRGSPRLFLGSISVNGAKGATVNTQLERATQLTAGTRFTAARLAQALEQMRQTLADNGFHQSTITPTLTRHPEEQLVDVAFQVNSGPQARVGAVEVRATLA